jgi:choline dehydrogenase-like flavoprotein
VFVDARKLAAGSRLDAAICIIGAGPAGITLAREFAGTALDVVVLESGGFSYDAATQALARGNVIGGKDGDLGIEYSDLEVERVRFFGGATDHWGGECSPLDPVDFSERAWIPHSGWPFAAAELEPYYRRAARVIEIGEFERFVRDWDSVVHAHPARAALRFSGDTVIPRVFQDSAPTRFGTRYRADLDAATNVRVLLNANLVAFETDSSRRQVRGAQAACLRGPNFIVRAHAYVLATGTIENARLLLVVAGPEGKGFGNEHGLVGRFFQEHVAHRSVAEMLPAEQPPFNALKAANERGQVGATFTQEAQQRHELPNFTVIFSPKRAGSESAPVRSFQTLVGGIRAGAVPDRLWMHIRQVMSDLPTVARYAARRVSTSDELVSFFELVIVLEQMPNPDSRVRLGRERDALGMPIPELEWRLTDQDRTLMLKCLDLTVREIGASGVGRVKVLVPEDGGDWLERVVHSHHPMGTTRMHNDPRHGVVDADCRVHGMDNLYVAGASVFPTGGAASPTYSIVAMAIRLADHLKAQTA